MGLPERTKPQANYSASVSIDGPLADIAKALLSEGIPTKTVAKALKLDEGDVEKLHNAALAGEGPMPMLLRNVASGDADRDAKAERGGEGDREEADVPAVAAEPRQQMAAAEEPLPIALYFPGESSARIGMLARVKDFPWAREMFHKAKQVLGYDILPVFLRGPERRELMRISVRQPAMFIAGLAAYEKLCRDREEVGARCQAVAGCSLGEFTALCAAGVFSFEVGLELVKLRGEAMEELADAGKQIFIVGLERAALEKLCLGVERDLGEFCRISDDVCPQCHGCGGSEKAIQELKARATAEGSLHADILPNSAPYHTELMKPAEDKFRAALQRALPKMKPARCSVYITAGAPIKPGTRPEVIMKILERQMTCPFLKEQSVRAMIDDGVSEFYELSPVEELKDQIPHIDREMHGKTYNVLV